MMAQRIPVSWDLLKKNHHSYRGFRARLDNVFPESWSPCCIQLSHAMNNAGLDINPRAKDLRRQMVYKGKIYLINVPSVLRYFAEQGYEREVYKGSRADITLNLGGRRGIILFGTMHADLWEGGNIHRPEEYNLSVLWEHETTRSLGVSFFEVIEPLDNPFPDDAGGDAGYVGFLPDLDTSQGDLMAVGPRTRSGARVVESFDHDGGDEGQEEVSDPDQYPDDTEDPPEENEEREESPDEQSEQGEDESQDEDSFDDDAPNSRSEDDEFDE